MPDRINTGGIMPDDDRAMIRLRAKRLERKRHHTYMKTANRHYRKTGSMNRGPGHPTADEARARDAEVEERYAQLPFAPFELKNNLAELHRLNRRIEQIEADYRTPGFDPIDGDGFRVMDMREHNRIGIAITVALPTRAKNWLNQQGWRRSPYFDAWVRRRCLDGRSAATEAALALPGLLAEDHQ